jgi:hypothetical protein
VSGSNPYTATITGLSTMGSYIVAMGYTVSGKVFEDVNYGGGSGRNWTTASGSGGSARSSARVELFDSGGNYLTNATTDGSGNYSFSNYASGTYYVRTVTGSVTSSRTGYTGSCLPVMTFRTDAAGGSAADVTTYVGGHDPATADAGNASSGWVLNGATGAFSGGGSGKAHAFMQAAVGTANITGADFGWNFDTIANVNNTGQGSLRQFVTNANTLGGDASLAQSGLVAAKENAVFMISNGTAGSGLRSANNYFSGGIATISLASGLPTISTVVVLDAQKQPGWSSAPIIELNGAGAGSARGIDLSAGSSTVRGFVINRFASAPAIYIATAGSNTIQGNYIGTNSAGNAASANLQGIYVGAVSGNNVGGTGTSQGNVISGNNGYGIQVDGSSTVIQGNYIGTNAAGAAAVANTGYGIIVSATATSTTVGGTGTGAGNVISGNTGYGLQILSNGHTIQGNKIGINAAGNGGIANTTSGVYVSGANNSIGGSAGGAGNIIAYNTSSGIVVATGTATGNLISRNSIYSNGSIGIDLGANGVTANDGAKTGSQPNQYMDFPVFTAITLSGTSLTVSGYVGSAANQSTFASATVEIFKSDGDSSGYGEGQTYLGNLTADANGNFSGTISVSGLTYGNSITGTATDGSNNTSEFGANGVTSGTFYSKSSAAVSTPSNWNTARNGTGTDATAYGLGGTWIVQNSHSMTLSGSTGWDVSGTGTVEIESGGSWTNSSSGTVTTGTLHADNGGTYSHSTTASLPGTTRTFDATSTVNYSASADQSVVSLTYGHLTTSGSGTKTLAGNAAVAGDLTVSAGTLNLSTSTANRSSAGGTLTVSNGATLKIGGTNGFPSNYTTKSLGSTSTVEYSGANQSVSGETYGHLTLSGSGTKTVATGTTVAGNLTTSGTASASCSGSLTVNGNVSIGSSTGFNGGSGTIDFNGTLTVTSATFTSTSGSLYVYGDVSITGTTFDHHSGTIVLDGADATLTASGAALNNLTINRVTKAKAVSLGAHLTVQGTLTITSGYLIQDPSYNLWAGGINIGVNGILKNYGTGSLTLGGNVTNAGRVDFNGGGDATCTNSNRILIRSSVDGTQRSWSGDGVDIGMVDVDVKDQGGTAPITCYGSNSSGNNGANWTISNSCLHAPTAVNLISFAAGEDPSGVRLEWQTGFEVHNLGFHIYREGADGLQRLTPSPIAGSALFAGARTALTAGRRYVWWDRSSVGSSGARYWLEDIDTSGQSTKHGPVVAVAGTAAGSASSNSPLLSQLGRSDRTRPSVTSSRLEKQALVESSSGATAVKLGVRQTGWYRVTQAQLLAAGVPASADPRLFQMYVDGSEIPIQVKAKSEKKFDAGDTVEFYGTALDTRWTDTHVYWLSWGNAAGERIPLSPAGGANAVGPSYPATLEERPKTIYFAALLNGDEDNFFGSVITTDPLDETLTLANLDPSAPADAGLELTLQGATDDAHKVRVELNGVELGTVSFSGQATGSAGLHFSQNLLHNGSNTLRLTSLNGETDVSLVDTIRLNYYHLYASDGSAQWMSFPGGQAVTATGWPSPNVRIMDVTNPQSPVECAASVAAAGSAYSVTATAPTAQARVFAFDSSAALAPAFIKPFAATAFESSATVDVTIVTHPDFLSAASVLKQSQESSGLHSTIVTTEQLYDAYSYGAKSPDAIRAFVLRDRASRRKTRYLLLLGDASFDPRNYLGLGEYDYVPTKMVDTRVLEAASDDWFAIQQGGNLPLAAVGRLPVRTAAEADAVAAKIAAYRNQPLDAPWRKKALLVADENDSWDFERSNETLRANLETHLSVQTVYHGQLGTPATRTAILNGINDGQGWVNYFGHGSVDLWRDGVLTSSDAAALTNSAMLPVFFDMTCLNGYFTDLYSESLGEALLKAPNGGAVGVWASSGLTEPAGQVTMNLEVWRQLQLPGATLGQSMIGAKQVATDTDVRQTWVLLGDPSLPSPLAAPVPADTTPPAISTVSDLSGQTWALIYWRTDEDADAQVKYGTAVPYSSASSLDTTLQTDHYVMLTGLQPGTLYHYQVLSSDSAGNSASSTNYTFKTKDAPDTTPPVISEVNATVATNTVTITWKTDENADAQVEYGTSNSLRRPRELTAVQKDDSTSHSVMIEGLSPKTRYHYRVQSRDAAGNLAVSEDYSFTTLKANDGGVRLMTDTPGRIGLMAPVSATEYGISTGRSSISERLFAARTGETAVQTGIALVNLGA